MGRAPCCEKLGLKRGRWTAEEDEILINYIHANGEGSWRTLPKNAGIYSFLFIFPFFVFFCFFYNTWGIWSKLALPDSGRGERALNSLKILFNLLCGGWWFEGLLRCGKSCRLRWINYLREDLKRGNITAEEEETIVNLHSSLGNRYVHIYTLVILLKAYIYIYIYTNHKTTREPSRFLRKSS